MKMYRSPFVDKPRFINAFGIKGSMWKSGWHTGEDWDCDNTTLVAIDDGRVLRVNDCGASYGNHVVISTSDGRCYLMAHMRYTPKVNVGQRVIKGQIVGVMGTTGNSTGVHLHIELLNSRSWGYAVSTLVKPSLYIDFNAVSDKTVSKPVAKGDFVPVKKFKNTSKNDLAVYADTALTVQVGTQDAGDTEDCLAVDFYKKEPRALIRYTVNGKSSLKVGYVDATKGVIS